MKIDKKLIKELVDHLSEFNLTELEYQEAQTKIKVSRGSKISEQSKTSSIVSPNLNSSFLSDGNSILIEVEFEPIVFVELTFTISEGS